MIWLGDYDWRPASPAVIYPPPLPIGALKLYGVYPWPNEDLADWVHAEDVAAARLLLPSDRVFRRVAEEGPFVVLAYGEARVRVRPAMCRIISGDGLDIGDAVEVRSHFGLNDPAVGVIKEMRYPRAGQSIQYFVRKGAQLLPTPFSARDLQPVRLCPSV
jgi:hypothetical protein